MQNVIDLRNRQFFFKVVYVDDVPCFVHVVADIAFVACSRSVMPYLIYKLKREMLKRVIERELFAHGITPIVRVGDGKVTILFAGKEYVYGVKMYRAKNSGKIDKYYVHVYKAVLT